MNPPASAGGFGMRPPEFAALTAFLNSYPRSGLDEIRVQGCGGAGRRLELPRRQA